MPSPYLSKSDFKAAMDCRTKLYYRKNRYPSNLDENEYLRFLADGGFMIEFLVKARFPTGIDLVDLRDPEAAFARTRQHLEAGDVTLFEAAFRHGKYYVRTDVLRREGNTLHLIEVKSASLGDDDDDAISPFLTKKGTIESRWREYLMDVAFQTMVVRKAFPEFRVRPQLCVVNKGALATDAETLGRFTLGKDASNPKSRPAVQYSGDVRALANSKLVTFRSVEKETDLLMPEVIRLAESLAALLTPADVTRFQEDIAGQYRQCRGCEYRVKGGDKNGFGECWGKLADATPHILDLYQVARIAKSEANDPVPALLRRGRASLLDLNEDDLGKAGTLRDRRLMQWEAMHAKTGEHLPSVLRKELASHQRDPGWPLHFVDFEACNISLPHHVGLRPYERVAFQWSCHSLAEDGTLTHTEWLNTKREFPNFAFVRSLRDQLGETGTVYVWSPYEQSTLKGILEQIATWVARAPDEAVRLSGLPDQAALDELTGWIENLLGPEDEKGKRHSNRIRDLHDLARKHYFHPLMGGRTSIKVVLPAVWSEGQHLWQHPAFKKYYRADETGKPLDPYKVLPGLPLGDDDDAEEAVREGTGAVRVYQDMIFAKNPSGQHHAARQKLLLQYCKLDTAAMVMIWQHWTAEPA